MYKHILYATDFSKASLVTEKKVEQISAQFGAELSVIHVVDYPSTVWMGADGYYALADANENVNDDSKQALQACEKRLQHKLANLHSTQGTPKHEIVSYALEIDADLIVLGSHGHYSITDYLGTTATGVLHKAGCDVLVIQSGEQRSIPKLLF